MDTKENASEFIKHLIEGNNAFVQGDFEKALQSYEKSIECKHDFATTYAKLGQVYHKLGNNAEAIYNYKKSLELNPDQIETLYRLGKAYGDSDMAIQSAVAFDLARERDKEGLFSDRIDDSQMRVRSRSRKKSLKNVSLISMMEETASIMTKHPAVFIPVIVSVLFIGLTDLIIRLIFGFIPGHVEILDLTKVFFTSGLHLNLQTIIYAAVQIIVLSTVSFPLYGVSMVLVRRFASGREASFDEAVLSAFRQYSSLSGAALLFTIFTLLVAVASIFVMESFSIMFSELAGIDLNLRPFCILFMTMFAAYFYHGLTIIVLDRKKMEKIFDKTFRLGTRYYTQTFLVLASFALIYFFAIKRMSVSGGAGMVFSKLVLILSQAVVIVSLTVLFTKSQQKRKRKESSGSKKQKIAVTEIPDVE
ncbi:MAG TPA: tetratricopeptide repeat protein [bacterium]|nr:tetratricopeptide repeat protein [bacterium]